tara:strand:+ start:285 stop:527 length:243 start_codon:yes stop_codon:yes gene_type:complete
MDIYPIRLGVTFGLIYFLFILVLSKIDKLDYSKLVFSFISKMYPNCNIDNITTCLLFGFIDGFIIGIVIGYLYKYLPINY